MRRNKIPQEEIERIMLSYERGQKLSRHDILAMGVGMRLKNLRRAMENRNPAPTSRIQWLRRRLERTRELERRQWARELEASYANHA